MYSITIVNGQLENKRNKMELKRRRKSSQQLSLPHRGARTVITNAVGGAGYHPKKRHYAAQRKTLHPKTVGAVRRNNTT